MGRYVFKLPDLGEGIAEAELVNWHTQLGDDISEDQLLADLMTDKATVEITSPVAGRIVERNGEAGAMVAIGSVLVVLETAGGSGAAQDTAPAPEPPEPAPAPIAMAEAGTRPLASPAVRQRAEALGINLQFVRGSGPDGRISHADLDAFLIGRQRPAAASGQRREGVASEKIIGLRRRIADRMAESNRRIPHFAYIEEIDVTALEALRQALNARHAMARQKLTVLPFLLRALARTLPEYPQINAHFDDEAGVLHRHAAFHAGIATQTPAGLMVPVLRHAEALDLWETAAEIARLAEAARSGKAQREDLTGSTLTITSLGTLGGVATTPVINPPEVAILGPNKIVERPMVINGQIAIRKMMNLSASFDHRVVDGADAAAFIQRIKAALEQPATLFLD